MKRKIHYVSLISEPEQDLRPKKSKRKAQVTVFTSLIVAGMVISLIIPLRPTVSASEKRELAKFPEFSWNSLLTGEYFSGIDTWFSDTFPFRETLTGVNTKLTSWYGFGDKVSSLNDGKGDDIPDAPTRPDESDLPPEEELTQAEEPTSSQDTTQASETVSQNEESESTQPSISDTTVPANEGETQTPPPPKKTETLGGVLVAGKAGYEYYNFVKDTADTYIKAVNRAAKKFDGKATVYDLVIPTSIDITLDDSTRASISSSDQKKAIEYIYGSLSEKVKTVNIFDTLKSHRSEYIYYRTDHHWTALGAYYGYSEFIKAAGKTPVDLSRFEQVSYGEFLGSFYSDTKQNKKLEKNSDELIAYKPYYSTTMDFTDTKGNKYTWPIINDVSEYKSSYKYSCFAAGDQPYIKIVNNDIESGDACLVIKESFGNAMIPFLAGNYKKVYVIDYRYWNGNIYELAEKKNIVDVFFVNNISATRNSPLVDSIAGLTKAKQGE